MRVALVTEIPAPFRIPLFNALAQRVELRVFFLAEHDPRRPHYRVPSEEIAFDHTVVPGWGFRRGGAWVVASRGTRRALRRARPDVVITGGWNQPAMWAARTLRRPTLVWVESTLRDARRGSRPGELLKRGYLRTAAGAIVPGRAAAEYVRSLGVGDERIHVAPNAVDTSIFTVEPAPHDGCVLLYVGRLDPEKGVDRLLRAVGGLDAELRIVGAGREEVALRRAAPPNVTFLGARDRDELPPLYAGADVLVLPSLSEPWGMVLNEAAAAGLALVATDAVGAALDLVEDGANGYVVPAGEVEPLRDALQRLVGDADLRRRFGNRSRAIATRFTPAAWADEVVRAAQGLRSDA